MRRPRRRCSGRSGLIWSCGRIPPSAQANLGAWLHRSPDRNQAEAALKRSLALEPTFIGHMAYAEYLFDDNRLPESQEQLNNAEKIDANKVW